MKIINPSWGIRWVVLGLLISTASHATQRIMSDTGSEYVGSQETITYSGIYSVSSPQTGEETGIGLRVHYNSSLLTPVANQLYSVGAQPEGAITDDTEDYDSDPLTDKYFILSWVDTNAQWPGQSALPLTLFESEFETVANFSESTDIRITASSTAQNGPLLPTYLKVCPKPTLNIARIISPYPNAIIPENGGHATIEIVANQSTECGSLAVNYNVTGTATSGNDFTVQTPPLNNYDASSPGTTVLNVSAKDDNETEADETVIVTLSEGTDYLVGSPASTAITIQSEDIPVILPEVNLSTGKTSVTEGNSGSLLIYVIRDGENLSSPLEVFLQLGGTASAGSDYLNFPSSIIIPTGKTRGFATLVLKDDASNESQEVITLSISANEQYQRGTSSTLQLTIEDDEISQNTNLPVDQETKTTSNAIPTLNEWTLLLMSLFMAGLALTHLTDKKHLLTKTLKPAIPTTNRRGKT